MVRGMMRFVSLAVLLALAFSAAACGGADTAGSSGSPSPSAQAQVDSVLKAWPQADAAVKTLADDSVLLSVGTGGLALADVPESWTYTYFSPHTKRTYVVLVENGTAQPAFDMGRGKTDMEARAVIDIESINVGAAEAVTLAREFGEKSGAVPKNVMVNGMFAEISGAADLGRKTGVWTVTFATGAGLADAVVFKVDMMSGAVTAAN